MNFRDERYVIRCRPFTPTGWFVLCYLACLFGIPALMWWLAK